MFKARTRRNTDTPTNDFPNKSYFAYVLVSNFEAENLSEFINSSMLENSLAKDAPKLYSFISLVRNEQVTKHLQQSSMRHVPASLHLLAGSIHAERVGNL